MTENSIHPETTVGYIQLTVADLERAVDFYQRVLGFKLHRQEGDTAALGAGGSDLLALTERPQAPRPRGTTGLYHFAILRPSRLELAQSLKRLAETRTPVQGFADHYVSEAIYLADPDGNGIEVYRDRPRSEWHDAQGNFRMGTDPLDVDSLLAELKGHDEAWMGLDPATVLGHVHLHVRNIPEALKFYHDLLGFEVMMNMGSALFVSAGGYHHHLGLNVWAGVGAPPPPLEAIGLRHFTIQLPNQSELDRLLSRVREAGIAVEKHTTGWLTRDPSQNGLVFTTKGQV